MKHIHEVHERIYKHLIAKHHADPEFRFSTRLTNRFGRLDKGYWFHGNEHYLVVSFWSGMDWMNKTPNIMFVYTETECYLEVSVWDSPAKRDFVDKYLVDYITGLIPEGKYFKTLGSPLKEDYLEILETFLGWDKIQIDKRIRECEGLLNTGEGSIWFIDEKQFASATKKIEKYREWLKQQERIIKIEEIFDEPLRIRNVAIKTFPGLTSCSITNIPDNNQCIFLTGENGTGKTSILRAIGAALSYDYAVMKEKDYDVLIELSRYDKEFEINFNNENENDGTERVPIDGYVGYGPYRLMTSRAENGTVAVREDRNVFAPNDSLFLPNAPLIDIEEGLEEWSKSNTVSDVESIDFRKRIIQEVIADILPNFNGVIWGHFENEQWSPTKYRIGTKDDNPVGEEGTPEDIHSVPFYNLATGARSVLAMIGDMMVRLFRQQPKITDIADLKGVVLIDEIDIHLHPAFQKLLVRQLVGDFPKVQFIISTHSPIPLLGAPENSMFFVVKRDYNQTTTIVPIPDIQVRSLTPNTILTSPIFGMQQILHWDENDSNDLRTEDSWSELKIHDSQLSSLISKYKNRIKNDKA